MTAATIRSKGKDITEAVQIMYDIVHSSMDWGSGFLDNQEIETVIDLAVLMGWQVPPLPGNSAPMVSVARKYPDHYDIVENGNFRPSIRVKRG